tara:strand:- start:1471 stop:2745 length:1275 start_codon:yes stop_codon:yes gene_type:complete
MKTLQEQYNLIKEGKGHKGVFLKEAKRKFPQMINKAATYDQAAYILKKRSVISENYIDVKPLNTIESRPKQNWEEKFSQFINESGEKSLNPIVNNNEDYNKRDENVSADPNYKFDIENGSYGSYKNVSAGVENIASHNYDYSPKVDNINNVNAQELQVGIYAEVKYNPELTLEEAQAKVIKNLAKDPLYYVKEGQFGVQGLGYKEQKTEESTGKTYGGSGFSDKVKESDNNWQVVKESLVATSGNPNSLAAMSGEVIDKMLEEEGLAQKPQTEALQDFETQAPMEPQPTAEAKKDHDGDGDIDSDDYLAARDKAIKANMKKKPKKENIETKLAEIGKAGDITKMEAQLEFLTNHISEKQERLSSINEDENLKELIDKKKMKDMQREIKLLEKRKQKMEKLYEKMSGKSFSMPQVVGEEEKEDNE